MDRTSKHGLDLIGIAGAKLKGVWGKGFLGTFMYVTPLIALLFVPYVGWALSIAVFGWLTAGYVEFMKGLLKGENPKYARIFNTVHEFAQATLIGVILCCGIVLGLVVFIIPGVIIIGYYSMTFFVLDEQAITGISDSLNLASLKMEGNKTAMFAYKVVYYLLYLIVAAIALVTVIFLLKLYGTQQVLAICLAVVDVLVILVLLSIVTLYFYASNVVFYNEIVRQKLVEYSVKKPVEGTDLNELNVKSATEVAPVATEAKVEEKVEEKAAKPAAKKAPATAAKKPATAKTAAKPAAAKAESKPAAKKSTTKKSN